VVWDYNWFVFFFFSLQFPLLVPCNFWQNATCKLRISRFGIWPAVWSNGYYLHAFKIPPCLIRRMVMLTKVIVSMALVSFLSSSMFSSNNNFSFNFLFSTIMDYFVFIFMTDSFWPTFVGVERILQRKIFFVNMESGNWKASSCMLTWIYFKICWYLLLEGPNTVVFVIYSKLLFMLYINFYRFYILKCPFSRYYSFFVHWMSLTY